MAWHASGEERAKSFQVYKDLEARFRAVQDELSEARSLLASKNRTIAYLSAELSSALGEAFDIDESIPAPSVKEPVEPNVEPVMAQSERAPIRPLAKTQLVGAKQSLKDVLSGGKK